MSRALKQLVSEGKLVKLGVGIYSKAKPGVLSGNPVPVRPVDVLAPVALKKPGVKYRVDFSISHAPATVFSEFCQFNLIQEISGRFFQPTPDDFS